MNIVYLIGNGFDLRLGLPTRYEDFLEFYKKQHPYYSDNDGVIRKYKKAFFLEMEKQEGLGRVQWKDLEIALGEFTSSCGSDIDGFRDFYVDMNSALKTYLSSCDDLKPTQEEIDKMRKDIVYPYLGLNKKEQKALGDKIIDNHWYVDVITFNYTSSFEALCEGALMLNEAHYPTEGNSGYPIVYRGVKHVHGMLKDDDNILLGVDNPGQITNRLYKEEEDVTNLLVKPQGNGVCGTMVDDDCLRLIAEADLICLFGVSLGPTDQMWWTAVKERYLSNPHVILLYFHYDPSPKHTLPVDGRPKRKARQQLIDALGLEGDQKAYEERVFVTINSDMFPARIKKLRSKIRHGMLRNETPIFPEYVVDHSDSLLQDRSYRMSSLHPFDITDDDFEDISESFKGVSGRVTRSKSKQSDLTQQRLNKILSAIKERE